MKFSFLFLFIFSLTNLFAQPNILWIVCEDISPNLSFYGDSTANTPNLDALASESMIYDNAFTVVGVCAPTRSSIITGMYPTSIGTMHMRTGKDYVSWGRRVYQDKIPISDIAGDTIREYAAVPPPEVKCFPEYLRAAGYFCTNNQKTDYQFAAPRTAWDQNDNNAHWRNRPKGKPFFSVFNFNETHESQIWKKNKLPLTVDPKSVPVPPYFADTETSRNDIARHYSNIELMDKRVGDLIQQLKEDGLYEETIIFFYSDHGGPLPRQKREIYDSGLKVPFLVKSPQQKETGRTDRLISFVDLAPTILSLAVVPIPEYIQGKAFLGAFQEEPRKVIFGSSDRFDEYTDRSRMVRDHQFLYVRNFYPALKKYKDVSYRKNIPMMNEMLNLESQGRLNAQQQFWFGDKTIEELYDCHSDPHNIINLADHPDYQFVLNRMKKQYLFQVAKIPDLGVLPEAQLIDMMWPNGKQPQATTPICTVKNDIIYLKSGTSGSSIAYLFSDQPIDASDLKLPWQLYTQPLNLAKQQYLYFMAERIGYKTSPISNRKLEE